MSTIEPPGAGANMSEYTRGGGKVAKPDYEFEENMPPLDTIAPAAPTSFLLNNMVLTKIAP